MDCRRLCYIFWNVGRKSILLRDVIQCHNWSNSGGCGIIHCEILSFGEFGRKILSQLSFFNLETPKIRNPFCFYCYCRNCPNYLHFHSIFSFSRNFECFLLFGDDRYLLELSQFKKIGLLRQSSS